VFSRQIFLTASLSLATTVFAQQPAAQQQPPVKVNVINVCTPSADDQKELSSALAKATGKLAFASDYEVARGHSTLDSSTPIPGMQPMPAGTSSSADWVRIRREFPNTTTFSNAQYSFSVDPKNMVETLVLRVREPKDLMQVSVEDSASTIASPSSMLLSNTPVSRIKLERFGKPSVVLARCTGADGPPIDQKLYEPIFKAASSLMNQYRTSLGVRRMVPEELSRLGSAKAPKAAPANKKNP
jgi:hypothetical protein